VDIKLKVTQESFDEFFSIEEWINLWQISNTDMYEKMICFVADDEGNIIPKEEARKKFKKIPKKQWPEYITAFMKAISEAFVNPTSGSS
jgi:hypothetical protein